MDVKELSSGNAHHMQVYTVLANELRAHYRDDGYVGRSFEIKKYKPQAGKRYATFAINEIKLVNEPAPQSSIQNVLEELSAAQS
jgi:hypothetical protein